MESFPERRSSESGGSAPPETRPGGPADWEDELTGLPGPAFWQAILAAESARDTRYGRTATVVFVELAGLPQLADLWGADVATQAIASLAGILRAGSRASDYLARLDAGRFGVILTETDEVAAVNFVERVRDRCDRELGGAPESVRVAFGWASPHGAVTLQTMAATAEARLRDELGS